jgi:hypothetical protein
MLSGRYRLIEEIARHHPSVIGLRGFVARL